MRPLGRGRHGAVVQRVLRLAAGVLVTVLTVWALMPIWQNLASRAVLFSSVVAVPDAGLSALREHFSSDIYTPSASGSSSQSHTTTPELTPVEPPSTLQSEQSSSAYIPPHPDDIPPEFVGTLLSETMVGDDSEAYLSVGAGYLQNYTSLTHDDITRTIAGTPLLSISAEGPQVLIFHTHATESFETYDSEVFDTRNEWRTLDDDLNMCAVGEVMAESLRAQGVEVIHDTTHHDYPSYNGAYDNSAETLEHILAENPTIKVVIDLHRDAILPDETTTVKPVTTIDGEKVAQVMIATGCESDIIDLPNWPENLRFAVELQNQLESDYPTLTRPIFFNYRQYNLEVSPGSLLIEMGSVGNTIDEAKRSAELVANSLATVLKRMEE